MKRNQGLAEQPIHLSQAAGPPRAQRLYTFRFALYALICLGVLLIVMFVPRVNCTGYQVSSQYKNNGNSHNHTAQIPNNDRVFCASGSVWPVRLGNRDTNKILTAKTP